MAESCAEFVSVLLNARTQAHVFHLGTKSYAMHKALGSFYPAIGDFADKWVEAYQGMEGELVTGIEPPKKFASGDAAVAGYFRDLEEYVRDVADDLPKSPDLANIHADILGLIHATQYKLTFLA